MATRLVAGVGNLLRTMTVEPVMLVDGACREAMLIYTENVQMNKICSVKLGYSPEVCGNLSAYHEPNVAVQRELTLFTFYNSIIQSVLPLIYVLFMGAWSDKYGRKIPMLMTLAGRLFSSGGYLLANWQTNWPVEVLYPVTLLEALGGGNAGILSSTISYISDICREGERTSRLSTANSLWFLGSPLGTLLAALLIQNGGYNLPLSLVFFTNIGVFAYVFVFIKESHGPNAKKELTAQGSLQPQDSLPIKKVTFANMVKDFFDWHRVAESFRTTFKKRDGNVRAVLLTVLVGNMLRRIARGFFMYQFVREVLQWDASGYGYWITYRNLLAALGSLFLVPFMTRKLSFSDTSLVVLGASSLILEYLCYGLTNDASKAFLMWLGPPAGLISNSCVIAFKAMATKLVKSQEKGRISAVMAAVNGLMPMVGYAAYSPIYYTTVDTFPGAQFYFGASLNLIIVVAFIALGVLQVSKAYNVDDLEKGRDAAAGKKALRVLKKRSSVTLKAVARTFSLPGGRSVIRVPSANKLPPYTAHHPLDEEEEDTAAAAVAAAAATVMGTVCFSNMLSDEELMASESACDVLREALAHPEALASQPESGSVQLEPGSSKTGSFSLQQEPDSSHA